MRKHNELAQNINTLKVDIGEVRKQLNSIDNLIKQGEEVG